MPQTPPPYPGAAKCPTCDHWAIEHTYPCQYRWDGQKWITHTEVNSADSNMATLYKITRSDMTTHGGFTYHVGEWTPRVTGVGDLCSSSYYHAYLSPQLALLLNPIHGAYAEPFRLWQAEGKIAKRDYELKVGVRSLKLTREIAVPVVSTEQRVTFALYCALTLSPRDRSFTQWAEAWLSEDDRSEAAATQAATEAATQAMQAAARAAAAWAAEAKARAAAAAWAAAVAAAAEGARDTSQDTRSQINQIAIEVMAREDTEKKV